jgi:hypothetical protein
MLENKVQGPIYKTVYFDLVEAKECLGAKAYSVSKVNQLVVLFVGGIWFLLLINSAAHLSPCCRQLCHAVLKNASMLNILAVMGVVVPVAFMFVIRCCGRSDHQAITEKRDSVLVRRSSSIR